MSAKTWPQPVSVDPDRADLPESVAAVVDAAPGRDSILVLLAGHDAHASGWAERTAIRLAERMAGDDRRVVLADLGFEEPSLHDRLGASGEEGMADVFLYGTSLRRAARPVKDRAFYFAPAGTYAGDAETLLGHDAWSRIGEGFREADATLLVYLPAATPGAELLVGRVGRAIALGEAEELAALQAAGAGADFAAVLTPPAGVDVGAIRRMIGEDVGGDALDEPAFIEREPVQSPRRRVSPLYLVLLVLALGVAAYALFGDRLAGAPAAEAAPDTTAVAQGEPRPVDTPLPYSILVETHQTLESASDRVGALRRSQPDVDFYIAPVPVYGRVWYSVLAGPIADSASANTLLDHLVDEGVKERAEEWGVRNTEWAYLLGVFDSRREAEQQVDTLAQSGVPAYVVPVDYTAGAPRYRVYTGAYETLEEAEAMASFLDDAGVTGQTLKRRTGRAGA